MNSSESAEAMVKMSLEGIEMVAKISGKGAEKIAILLYSMAKNKKKTKGKARLNTMLKCGSALKIFSIKQNELERFHNESKKYGVLYCALIDKADKKSKDKKSKDKKKEDKDGVIDIMVREEDAAKINRIVNKLKLSTVDIASIKNEVEKDKMDEMIKEAEAKGIEVKSDEEKLVEDIMSKPIQKENDIESNDLEKKNLSEPLSQNKKNSEMATNSKKTSVRETLKNIINELKTKQISKEEKGTRKKENNKAIIDTDKKKVTEHKNSEKNINKKSLKQKKRKER